ncbi:MAG: hypothetical protein NEHIOOID_00112 [Holosporales bacterium]
MTNQNIQLPSAINQEDAQHLYDTLMNAIDSSIHLEIDASKVERIGTSGIQVLVAAGRHLKDLGGSFHVKQCSNEFSQAFSDLGLVSFLQEWGTK